MTPEYLETRGKSRHEPEAVTSHGRYLAFQMAEVAIPRELFTGILHLIAELQPPPDPSPAWTARLPYVSAKTRGNHDLKKTELS